MKPSLPVVHLKRGKAGPAIGRYPWVFAGEIDRVDGKPGDGAEVRVQGDDGRFIARGFFNSRSAIRVRLAHFKDEALDDGWIRARIDEAVDLRARLFGHSAEGFTNGYRVVFSDSDSLSGLTVDRFGDYLVMQITSLAMYERRQGVIDALVQRLSPLGILIKGSKSVAQQEGLEIEDTAVYGRIPDEPAQILENGIRFEVDLRKGQKTGFFFDQRENRLQVAKFADGAKALDLCCYTGGFTLNLLKGGAASVIGVDSSESAIEKARANLALNGLHRAEFVHADVHEWLKAHSAEKPGDLFDLVVLDPPRLAPNQKSKDRALRAYFSYNESAIKVLKRGGLLATFSCSAAITQADFLSLVSSVGRRSGRSIQVIHSGIQASDHPVLAHCPETLYLKFLLCRVM
jgi:23S rRNA (cytosine1962-C5)-methyltransferase